MTLPKYRCHKEVFALKIRAMRRDPDSTLISFDGDYDDIRVTSYWTEKHEPRVGGYYVIYKDGYSSFSPPEAFEEGYTRIEE